MDINQFSEKLQGIVMKALQQATTSSCPDSKNESLDTLKEHNKRPDRKIRSFQFIRSQYSFASSHRLFSKKIRARFNKGVTFISSLLCI